MSCLLSLYEATAGDGWLNSTGWTAEGDPCGWYGVACDATGGVTSLDGLRANNLRGSLPACVCNLTADILARRNSTSATATIDDEAVAVVPLVESAGVAWLHWFGSGLPFAPNDLGWAQWRDDPFTSPWDAAHTDLCVEGGYTPHKPHDPSDLIAGATVPSVVAGLTLLVCASRLFVRAHRPAVGPSSGDALGLPVVLVAAAAVDFATSIGWMIPLRDCDAAVNANYRFMCDPLNPRNEHGVFPESGLIGLGGVLSDALGVAACLSLASAVPTAAATEPRTTGTVAVLALAATMRLVALGALLSKYAYIYRHHPRYIRSISYFGGVIEGGIPSDEDGIIAVAALLPPLLGLSVGLLGLQSSLAWRVVAQIRSSATTEQEAARLTAPARGRARSDPGSAAGGELQLSPL